MTIEAGKLRERVTFDRRIDTNPDAPADYGNVVSEWVQQFTCAAEYIHLRGSETVMAGRLQGRHPQVVRVRSSSLTRQVATDWRVRDTRRGTEFAIRDVTIDPDGDGAAVDILVESGPAA